MKRDRLFAAAFITLLIAGIVPLWIGRYLPLLDIPNHLSAIAVWHHHHDPRFDFDKYYDLNLSLMPYWAHYYFCHLLAYLFDVEVANKIFLTLYAAALPTGALLLARRWNRSPWLSLFTFPLVWNFNLAEGFIAFAAGMGALVMSLVVVDRHARRPSLTSGMLVLALGSFAYFFHLLTYMMFLLCAGLVILAQERPFAPERLVMRGVPLLGSTAIGIWAYLHNAGMGFMSMSGTREFVNDPWVQTLSRAPGRLLNFLSSGRDEWVVVVLALAWFALALSGARRRDPDAEPRGLRSYAPELCFGACVVAILWLPRSMARPFAWYMINGRFVPLAALFGALLIRGPIEGNRRWLFAPVVAACLFYAIDLSVMMVRFNQRVAGFDRVVAQIPLHQSTLTLIFPPLGDDQINVNCFNQWPSYTQIRRGGYNFYNFNYGFPLKYKVYKNAPPWSHAEYFNWGSHAEQWDYFLTHNEGKPYSTFNVFPPLAAQGKVRLVAEDGPWRLWHKVATQPLVPVVPPVPPVP